MGRPKRPPEHINCVSCGGSLPPPNERRSDMKFHAGCKDAYNNALDPRGFGVREVSFESLGRHDRMMVESEPNPAPSAWDRLNFLAAELQRIGHTMNPQYLVTQIVLRHQQDVLPTALAEAADPDERRDVEQQIADVNATLHAIDEAMRKRNAEIVADLIRQTAGT